MGTLPADGTVVARKRRGPSSAVALLAALLAVVLVLSGLSFVLLDIGSPAPDEDGGDGPPPPQEDFLVIGFDTTWRNVSAPLDTVLSIASGATLTLEDCDLTLDLEDLVLFKMPHIAVSPAGALVLRNSRLRVLVDQNLTDAYITDEDWGQWSYQWESPSVSRVVNLAHARRPVLAFNASLRLATTDLLVMGQPSPDGPLQLLARLPMREGAWERFEVDLSPIAGGVARVAIAPLRLGEGSMLIASARVLDGEQAIQGDAFETGDLALDGWHLNGFDRFSRPGSDDFIPYVSELVYAEGDVRLVDSSVEAPAMMPRRVDADDEQIDQYTRMGWADSWYHHARIGAQIEVVGASLEVERSRIVNVPLRAEDASVTVADSVLEGDAELLTMRLCQADVGSSSFVRRPSTSVTSTNTLEDRFLHWAISAEGGAPVWMEGCTIEGGAVGLYLEDVGAKVDGCAFGNSTEACLWAHNATGLGGWSRLDRTCTFDTLARGNPGDASYAYIETRPCIVRAVWLKYDGFNDIPVRPECHLAEGTGELRDLPLIWEVGGGNGWMLLMMPALLVRDNGTMLSVADVAIQVRVEVPDATLEWTIRVVQGTPEVLVEFDEEDIYEAQDPIARARDHALMYISLWPGARPGAVELNVSVERTTLYDLSIQNHTLRISLDGAVVAELDLALEGTDLDYYTYACHTLDVPVGHHAIDVELLGREWEGSRLETISNETLWVMRANGTTPPEEVEDRVDYYTHLLLDPGTDLLLGRLKTWETGGYRLTWLDALLWPGSNLTIDDVGSDSWEGDFAYVFAYGPGAITLRRWHVSSLDLSVQGPAVRLEGFRCEYVSASIMEGDLTVVASSFEVGLYADGGWYGDLNVTVDGCTFEASGGTTVPLGIYGADRLVLRDCTFEGSAPAMCYIRPTSPASVEVEGCDMNGTGLLILASEGRPEDVTGVAVRNCTLRGEGAYLVVASRDSLNVESEGVALDATGNAFEGTGTGATLARGLLPGFHGNTLGPGSGLVAFRPYWVAKPDGDWYELVDFDVLGLGGAPPFADHLVNNDVVGHPYQFVAFVYDLVEGEAAFAYDGRPLTLVLHPEGEVVWFEEVAISTDEVTVNPQEWREVGYVLYTFIKGLIDAEDWWEQS